MGLIGFNRLQWIRQKIASRVLFFAFELGLNQRTAAPRRLAVGSMSFAGAFRVSLQFAEYITINPEIMWTFPTLIHVGFVQEPDAPNPLITFPIGLPYLR